MDPRSHAPIGRLPLAVLALASLPGCTAPGNRARTTPDSSGSIRWTVPVNGLVLGIEVPRSPFVFAPVPDWTGPLFSKEKDPSGRGTTVRIHPGGDWDEAAVLRVFARNISDHVILWSREREAWHVSFSAPDSAQPEPLPGTKPPPLWTGPIRLEAGETCSLEFPMSEVGDVWPPVPAGQYAVTVSYLPTDLTYRAQGSEEGWTHPYDVPGFWTGVIETPPIVITVRHSATAPAGSAPSEAAWSTARQQ